MTQFSLNFPYAAGEPQVTAVMRASNDDFRVDEVLGFALSGEGEHAYLHIQKNGENTDWVAGQIARFAGVTKTDVGYAGLKDRHAVTSQWFSVYLPKGAEPQWRELEQQLPNVRVLEEGRHKVKLRRGDHAGNQFNIRLTQVQAPESLISRLEQVAEAGVPNYFGEQRFGRGGNNLLLAAQWWENAKPVRDKRLRGLVMSAGRSWLFNQVLAHRVKQGNWRSLLAGDFPDDAGLPTGPLWGRGRSRVTDQALALEAEALAAWPEWLNGLEHCGLAQERRSMVSWPRQFGWQLEQEAVRLSFELLPGQFATTVLRELAQVKDATKDD